VSSRHIILTLLILHVRRVTIVRLFVKQLQSFVDKVSLFVLPLGINVLESFHKNSRTVTVIEIILLKGEHLIIELFVLIPSFEILLCI